MSYQGSVASCLRLIGHTTSISFREEKPVRRSPARTEREYVAMPVLAGGIGERYAIRVTRRDRALARSRAALERISRRGVRRSPARSASRTAAFRARRLRAGPRARGP